MDSPLGFLSHKNNIFCREVDHRRQSGPPGWLMLDNARFFLSRHLMHSIGVQQMDLASWRAFDMFTYSNGRVGSPKVDASNLCPHLALQNLPVMPCKISRRPHKAHQSYLVASTGTNKSLLRLKNGRDTEPRSSKGHSLKKSQASKATGGSSLPEYVPVVAWRNLEPH